MQRNYASDGYLCCVVVLTVSTVSTGVGLQTTLSAFGASAAE